jgi:hypothetical protein
MSEKDGGPAFPHLKPMFRYDGNGIATEVAPELNGMSLRDWFAGQALAACIEVTSQQTELHRIRETAKAKKIPEDQLTLTITAKMAYAYADAMLKARGET